jgi:hypothetical protein
MPKVITAWHHATIKNGKVKVGKQVDDEENLVEIQELDMTDVQKSIQEMANEVFRYNREQKDLLLRIQKKDTDATRIQQKRIEH